MDVSTRHRPLPASGRCDSYYQAVHNSDTNINSPTPPSSQPSSAPLYGRNTTKTGKGLKFQIKNFFTRDKRKKNPPAMNTELPTISEPKSDPAILQKNLSTLVTKILKKARKDKPEGLFRKSGVTHRINKLHQNMQENQNFTISASSINNDNDNDNGPYDFASTYKAILRDNRPLSQDDFAALSAIKTRHNNDATLHTNPEFTQKAEAIRQKLSPLQSQLLNSCASMVATISSIEAINMNHDNLAIAISPSMFEQPEQLADATIEGTRSKHQQAIFTALMKHFAPMEQATGKAAGKSKKQETAV